MVMGIGVIKIGGMQAIPFGAINYIVIWDLIIYFKDYMESPGSIIIFNIIMYRAPRIVARHIVHFNK